MISKLKPCLIAGLIALASVVILALYMGDSWIDPKLPVIIGAALILPISVIGALLMFPEANQGKARFVVQLLTVVSAAIFALGLPGLWTQEHVRTLAVEQGPELMVNLSAALNDPAPAVSQKACQRILRDPSRTEKLVELLQPRPTLALACLETAPEGPNRNAVSSKLRTNWHRILVSDPPPADADICAKATALADLPVDISQRVGDLFDCAVRAPQGQTRQCCATTLTSLSETCEDLAAQIDTKKLVDNNTVSTLGTLSYGESTAEAEFREVASFVDLQCPEMQAFAIKLSCASQSERTLSSDTNRFLDWKFGKDVGCLNAEDQAEPAEVHQICYELMEAAAEETTLSSEIICRSHLAAIDTNRKARETLGGLDSAQGAELAYKIAVGSDHQSRQRTDLKQWLNSIKDDPDSFDKNSLSAKDKRAMLQELMKNQRSPEEMLNQPFEQMKALQGDLKKLMATPAFNAGYKKNTKDMDDAPDMEDFGDTMDAQMEALEAAHKDAQETMRKARQ